MHTCVVKEHIIVRMQLSYTLINPCVRACIILTTAQSIVTKGRPLIMEPLIIAQAYVRMIYELTFV